MFTIAQQASNTKKLTGVQESSSLSQQQFHTVRSHTRKNN